MATPLIKSLRVSGGTIYVFNSASNDIAKTFSDDNFRFTFSKFAALDLPKVDIPSNNSNNINWQAIGNRQNEVGATGVSFDATVLNDVLNSKQNTNIANSFQNYVLNWENLILNQENSNGEIYDTSTYQTVTERLFWKWLIDLGAIRFNDATSDDSTTIDLYVEEQDNTDNTSLDTYNRVVKYLGDVSLINNVNRGGEAYTQVYLHIPTEHGNTPTVLFKNISDNNYKPSLSWVGTNGEDIEGRSGDHVDARMSIKAYFQDNTTNRYENGDVFGATGNTTIEISFDENGLNPYQVKLSNLDGLVLDWDEANYTKIANNPEIDSFSQLNSSGEAQNFDFNTVLIYYDVYDVSNPNNTKRNLYGVLFLDDFEESLNDGSVLKSFSKFKPNNITKLNGNSYSLKTNIKFDTSADNVGVERSINEYTTFSMDLFSDAMIQLQDATDSFIEQQLKIETLNDEVDNLKNFYFTQTTIEQFNKIVEDLQQSVNNALIGLESPSTLIELIRNNTVRINKLASGELTSELSYDLSPFTQGDGIKLDKSNPNQVRVINTVQKYNFFPICYNATNSLSYDVDNGVTDETNIDYPDKNNILNIGKYTNYFKNTTIGNTSIDNDIIINLDDTNVKFSSGQSFKIVFENEFALNDTKSLYIYSDAQNNRNLGKYKWLVGKLNNIDFISSKPIIEIICIDASAYKFSIDILR